MIDFGVLLTDEAKQQALLESEKLRGHHDSSTRLNKALGLASRIGSLKREARNLYSAAQNARGDRRLRDDLKHKAELLIAEAERLENERSVLATTFGNILHKEEFTRVPSHLRCSVNSAMMSLALCACRSFCDLTRLRQNLRTSVGRTHLGSYPQVEEWRKPASFDKLPLIQWLPNKQPFCLCSMRYIYDQNQILDDAAFEAVREALRKGHVTVPVHSRALPMSATRGVFLFADGDAFAAVYDEGDYSTRSANWRIDKQIRTKLSTSPFPHSILVDFFLPGHFADVNDTNAYSTERNTLDPLQYLGQADEHLHPLFEYLEETLNVASYLEGFEPSFVDYEVFRRLQHCKKWRQEFPSVQYPGVHRWHHHLERIIDAL